MSVTGVTLMDVEEVSNAENDKDCSNKRQMDEEECRDECKRLKKM